MRIRWATRDKILMIELIPKVFFLHDGPMKDIGKRFKKNFDQTWRRLPPAAKTVITEYFRQHRGTAYLCFRMDFDDQEPFGRCSYGLGCTAVTFLAPYFALTTTWKTKNNVGGKETTSDVRLWISEDAPLGGMVKLEVLGERGVPANTWLEFKESGSK
jgi:hypothetical protein